MIRSYTLALLYQADLIARFGLLLGVVCIVLPALSTLYVGVEPA